MSVRGISPATLAEWLSNGRARTVDVRESDEHSRSRIDGSELAPLSRFEARHLVKNDRIPPVLYCRTGRRSAEAAQRMVDAGAGEVVHLEGGLAAWERAGYPVAKARGAPISVMRQVQITAGGMVLLATLLTVWVSPWFLMLSGAAGAGLLIAGLTDTCAMAALLDRMPWNKAVTGIRGRQTNRPY